MQVLLRQLAAALLLLIAGLAPTCLRAEATFRSFSYTSLDGLPTNLTKAIVQDLDGYVWIGSDAGLVRYDGRNFVTYTAEVPSELVKDLLLQPSDGSILAVTDGGIGKVLAGVAGGLAYEPIAPARQERSDSALHYPKSVYRDREGTLWLSEGDAVVRVWDGHLKRYSFSAADQSESMLRAFLFTELSDGRLVLVSQRGGVFLWRPEQDSFESVPVENPDVVTKTYALLPREDDHIWVGTMDGVFELSMQEHQTTYRWEQRLPILLVSAMVADPAGNTYIGTWRDGIYFLAKGSELPEPIASFPFKTINDLFVGHENNTVWVSSDQGVGFFQPRFLTPHRIEGASPFTSLVKALDGTVLATDGNMVFRVRADGGKVHAEMIHDRNQAAPGGIASDGQGLWVGKDGVVDYAGVDEQYAIPLPVNYHVDFLELERGGSLWICQTGLVGVARMEPNRRVQYFGPENGLPSHVQVARQSADGQMLLGAEGIESYLYRFNPSTGAMTNLSVAIEEDGNQWSSIRLNDLVPAADGTIWLGSSIGLLQYRGGKVTRPPGTEELRSVMIKAVALDAEGRVWAGTDRGLYVFTKDQLVHFSTGEGLSNLAINWRSLVFDVAGALWIGTVDGLTYRPDPGANLNKTAKPVLTTVELEGKPVPGFRDAIGEFGPDSFVRLEWLSLSYPGSTVRYQWRFDGTEKWSKADSANQLLLPHLPPAHYRLLWRAQQEGQVWSEPAEYSFTILPPWFARPWARLLFVAVALSVIGAALGYRRDAIRRLKAEEELRINKERYTLVALGANDGMWDWNLNTDEVYFSPRWGAILGLPQQEWRGKPQDWFERVHADDLALLGNEIDLHRRGRTSCLQVELRMRHADGTYRWMLIRGVAVRDGEGRAYRMAGSKTDISDRKRGEEQLLHASLHDALTELPNRTLFLDRLERALTRARRNDSYLFAVLFLDLNRFKVVNDTMGHLVGDELLKLIARRLESCMREGDTVSRFGGDEFAVLLDDIAESADAEVIAQRILLSIATPCQIQGHDILPSTSIGVAISTSKYDRAEDAIHAADLAMYRAKKLGQGLYEVYESAIDDPEEQHPVDDAELSGEVKE